MENNLKSLIERAIKNEESASEFYLGLADAVADTATKDTLRFLAAEENTHRDFLLDFLEGRRSFKSMKLEDVVDARVAQFVSKPDIKSELDTVDVYLMAAHRELNSYSFYKNLAEMQPAGEVKDLLLLMANQEMKHKEKVEYLYTNTAFVQTAGG